jgi:hypothetical protein
MYPLLLFLHNLFRWLLILGAIWALGRAYRGWLGRRNWTSRDRQAGLFFSIAYDLQVLVGLVLTFLSPLVSTALSDLGAAMRVDDLRWILVEHGPLMVISLIIVHVVSALARRAESDTAKHRLAALGYSLALVVALVAIPWSRPLLRGLG